MSDWRMVALGSITTKIGSGATPRGGESVYRTEGTSLIRSQNVLDNSMRVDGVAHIDPDAAGALRGVTVYPNDVLINITGDSVARCALVEPSLLPARVNQHVAIIRASDEVDARYIQKVLVSPEYKSRLLTIATGGGTRNALTKTQLSEFLIPLPPLSTQQAIAEVLGAFDDKIAANTALAATADHFASTTLLRTLTLERVRLGSVARITMGSSPRGEDLNDAGDGVPFHQGVRDFGFRSPSRRIFTTASTRSADMGDILVSVRAPVGEVNVADEPLSIGRGLAAVRSTSQTQATLLHQLKMERDEWEPFMAEGTVFGSINRDQLHGISLRAVKADQADAVETTLAGVEASITVALTENRALAATRDALLPQLISGKLQVRDAEAAASAAGA